MKITSTPQKDSKIRFLVKAELDSGDLKKQKSKVVAEMGKDLKIQGFRPGKAPAKLIEEKLNKKSLEGEIARGAVDFAFNGMMQEFKFDLIAAPKMELKKFVDDQEAEIVFTVEVKPEVKLPDVSKWPKIKLDAKITEKEVSETLDQLATNSAKEKEVKRAAKSGDKVWLDFDGKDEKGKDIPGAKSANYPLTLGSKSFIPGFEEEVIGLRIGDEKSFIIKFPADYHAESLQNKQVEFTIKINKIAELSKPKIDDEFAKMVSQFSTLKELKTDIKSGLMERKERTLKEEQKDILAEKLANEAELEVPSLLLEENVESGLRNAKNQAAQRGQDWDQFVKESGFKDEEDLIKKEARPQAEKQVRISLSLRQYSEDNKLSVGKEELAGYTQVLLQQYQNPDAQKQIMSDQEQSRIEGRLLADKVLESLLEKTLS